MEKLNLETLHRGILEEKDNLVYLMGTFMKGPYNEDLIARSYRVYDNYLKICNSRCASIESEGVSNFKLWCEIKENISIIKVCLNILKSIVNKDALLEYDIKALIAERYDIDIDEVDVALGGVPYEEYDYNRIDVAPKEFVETVGSKHRKEANYVHNCIMQHLNTNKIRDAFAKLPKVFIYDLTLADVRRLLHENRDLDFDFLFTAICVIMRSEHRDSDINILGTRYRELVNKLRYQDVHN